ncbi:MULTISPECIES: LuxR C-terminal-related transcriptional regulator [Vibrio]|jgi:DNA-binding NarL/FixJ family response regulator|uniref:Helix-turn-helix transcriptional regulator n=1 Tax=Vibrio rotiferianus TaxID=190895 RepID=A0A7Y3Z7K4_9VIBR|nr:MULTISPECIES: LuxR C-terminal-related transcriptional regulator [Vibrio]MDK9777367.1 helix-turn-helix transcriptional regulator [Vibrio sp. D401a]MDK9808029.1 LuxR C-terminal-related transcriptional regulator [Vibrio sp. D406a]NOH47931.1 helix-turn-helix transcriptional regulator [Vibrio rotiferianus]USD52875.1 helix-turn-helix transcriptional regulator [Vibrio sp. SCSIO 43153]
MESIQVNPEVLLITQQSLQSENFRDMLASRVDTKITTINLDNPYQNLCSEKYYLLVDFSSDMSEEMMSHLKSDDRVIGTILLNLTKDLAIEELADWPLLKGIFKPTDSIDTLCKALKGILDGDNWLSRRMLDQLVSYHEAKKYRIEEPELEIDLTRREVQVLQMLKEGGSNMEIADSLFISEHTIKSHLYNIFRKIEVKNRNQATRWAKKNLKA